MVVTELNLTFAEMLEAQRTDILNSPFSSFIVGDDQQIFHSNHQKCLQEQSHRSYDLRLQKRTGEFLTVRLDSLPPLPSPENPCCYFAVRDISYFKELEDKLQKEVDLRQNILDALPCAAFLLKHDTHEIVASNKAAAGRGAIAGGICYQSWSQRDSPCPWCRGSALKYDGKAHHLQFWDRGTYWDNHWIPVADDFYLHCVFDITEQEKNKAALQISNDELERQVERRSAELKQSHRRLLNSEKLAAVGRVAVAIARKFNDPLQAITNVLGGIHRRGALEPEDLPLVNLAYEEVIKLNSLVKDLREFYQPTRGKTDLFDIRFELTKIIEMKRPLLIGKGIDITAEFTENIPFIHAVADQLNTMFQNLLDNCIETCRPGDSIRISTSVEKDTVVSEFEGGGSSIDHSAMSQIFDPLNSSKATVSSRSLELTKSYAIITMHGGSIETVVDNEKSSGFKVILPIQNSTGTIDPASI